MGNNFEDEEANLICDLINQRLGFSYGPEKKQLIHSRLGKRLQELNVDSYLAYLKLLQNDPDELNWFYVLLTTNVTSFFREAGQFHRLQQGLLAKLVEQKGKQQVINCWSAGCSSGEEPYTLGMVFRETLGQNWKIKILASDISIRKIQEGMNGIYEIERIVEVPQHLRARYFEEQPEKCFRIKPELRELVVFRKMNLVENWDIPTHIKFDVIFCRNVFIYLSEAAREKVLDGFYTYLNPGGFLFLGFSESINTSIDPRWRSLKNSIYQKMVK